ncbi:unnamed protein product [Protopolystoma xenopodis]|uniref:Uncharacterized protein n=1 Tax=Protopolystoma xenopodis TaxID=117903 RepID=A0A3S5CPV5_9PLAT|nr:unnamed protein product [Protopolystoma xenopodis]
MSVSSIIIWLSYTLNKCISLSFTSLTNFFPETCSIRARFGIQGNEPIRIYTGNTLELPYNLSQSAGGLLSRATKYYKSSTGLRGHIVASEGQNIDEQPSRQHCSWLCYCPNLEEYILWMQKNADFNRRHMALNDNNHVQTEGILDESIEINFLLTYCAPLPCFTETQVPRQFKTTNNRMGKTGNQNQGSHSASELTFNKWPTTWNSPTLVTPKPNKLGPIAGRVCGNMFSAAASTADTAWFQTFRCECSTGDNIECKLRPEMHTYKEVGSGYTDVYPQGKCKRPKRESFFIGFRHRNS